MKKSYDINNIVEYYIQIKSLTKVSKKFGFDKRTIKKILIDNNIYEERLKITDDIIKKILIDYSNNNNITFISKKYNIDHRTIVRILKKNNIKNRGNIRYDFDRRIFKNIDNEKKSYWLGFLYADGGIYKSKDNKSNHVTIKLSSKDKEHLLQLKKDFNLPHNIKIQKEHSFNKIYESATIRITSKDMVNDLIKHGCIPNKTFILQFPQIDEKLISHFIRGYFDGDGSISITKKTKNKQFVILGNYDFLNDIQKILIEKCKLNKTKIGKKNKIYSLNYGGNLNVEKFEKFIYENSLTYLKRKKNIFNQ